MESITRKPVPVAIVNPVTQNPPAGEGTIAPVRSEGESDEHYEAKLEPLPSATNHSSNLKDRLDAKIDKYLPPHRRYCGLSRRVACLVVTGIILVLLALIIGLSIGLSMRNGSRHLKLPLGSQTYTGDLTYYGTGLSACGVVANDNEDIVSISHFTFDAVSKGSNPNANPLCGHKIRAVRDGNSVDLTVVDRCVGCQPTDIDVSPGAFQKLADLGLGRVTVTWAWLPPVPST